MSLRPEIVRAETRAVSLPFARPLAPGYDAVEIVLLRLTDVDGAVGTGYLWCFGAAEARMLVETLHWLAPLARGRHEPDGLAATVRSRIGFFGLKGVAVFGLSAIDMAAQDLDCRRRGIALSESTGRRRDRVPAYWSGFAPTASLDELEEEAELASSRGFRAIKFRLTTGSLEEDERRLRHILELIPGFTVMIDVNQRFTIDEAIVAAEHFATYGIRWYEDAIAQNDYAGLGRLVEESAIPVATGENEYLREGFTQLLEAGVPYLLADVQRVGGIVEWNAVAVLAAERGAVLTSHAYPHVSAHLCAALDQDEVWCEYMPWFDGLFDYELEVVDGELVVPIRPGIGTDLDEDRIEHGARTAWTRVA